VCDVGFVADSTKTGCIPCDPGTYRGTADATCQNCSIGYKCPSAGLAVAVSCPDGEYQPDGGQTSCLSCPAGSECSDKINANACPAGTYAASSAVTCSACPQGKRLRCQ
ncbi:hypothetical protein LSH36_315g03011, partial [Paralvinella palmiformis]